MFFIPRYIAINMFVVISCLVEIHNLNNKVICKVTLSLTPYSHCFHPLSSLSVVSAKEGNFIKSQDEMLSFRI
jgi:hypothetical protein